MRRSFTLLLIIVGLVSYGSSAEKPKVERPKTEPESCITEECHLEHTGKETIHDPVTEGACEACHEADSVEEHTYVFTDERPALCYQCHDELSLPHVHGALEEVTCDRCHATHVSDNDFLLKADPVGNLCVECHDEIAKDATHVHGPTSVGECSLCHSAHESEYEKRLTMDPNTLCAFCHVTTAEELAKIEFLHEPAGGNCVGCHDPHGADNWKMLKAAAPDMCYPCHEEVQATAESSKHQHNAVLEEGGCLKCHTPHASSVKSLLADAPNALCMSCHDEPLGQTVDQVLPAFTAQIEGKAYLHGPITEESCSSCHLPHGSENFRMLSHEYPAGFYSAFDEANYQLCFECHEKTLVQTVDTNDLTDFRNGSQNLHFLHVNKTRRGRTCRACHQTHGSNHPKQIRTAVPYGGWKALPINFKKTETGGLCDPGCHLEKPYDREVPADYTVKPAGQFLRFAPR